MSSLPAAFAPQLIAWQREAGRHDLPWQSTRDPYRVWLSEVMLQQTQVATVLAYYPRFLARFPDVVSLAAADQDEVMSLWSGLGYYSRARHLHRCAQVVVREHGGCFPRTAEALQALPGIGASTAAAIAAFCHGERVSIVDGNVKRVLARLLAFDADLSDAATQRALWAKAQALLPSRASHDDMVAYTQGLMDLGATVCTRTRPRCPDCPVQALCEGRASGDPARWPVKSRRVARRFERWWLLVPTRDEAVWLQRRPERGIWAGLFAPLVFDGEAALQAALDVPDVARLQPMEAVAHSLTHRELQLMPWRLHGPSTTADWPGDWVPWAQVPGLGLPAPVRTLLQALAPQP